MSLQRMLFKFEQKKNFNAFLKLGSFYDLSFVFHNKKDFSTFI